MSQYHYRILGREIGPVSCESLLHEVISGRLGSADEFRRSNETEWTLLADFRPDIDARPDSQSSKESPTSREQYDMDTVASVAEPQIMIVPHAAHDTLRTSELSTHARTEDAVLQREHCNTSTLFLRNDANAIPVVSNSVVAMAESPPSPKRTLPQSQANPPTDSLWFVRMGRIERGPMDIHKLIDLANAGHLLPNDRIRKHNDSEWIVARSVPGIFKADSTSQRGAPFGTVPNTAPSPFAIPMGSLTSPKGEPSPIASTPVRPEGTISPPHIPWPQATHPPGPSTTHSTSRPYPPPNQLGHEIPFESRPTRPRNEEHQDDEVVDSENHSTPADSFDSPQALDAVDSRHRRRRGQFREPILIKLLNRRNVTLVVLACAIGFFILLRQPAPPSISDYAAPLTRLEAIALRIRLNQDSKLEYENEGNERQTLAGVIDTTMKSLKQRPSKHQIHDRLITAAEFVKRALNSNDKGEITTCLQQADDLFKVSRQEVIRSSLGRRTQISELIREN